MVAAVIKNSTRSLRYSAKVIIWSESVKQSIASESVEQEHGGADNIQRTTKLFLDPHPQLEINQRDDRPSEAANRPDREDQQNQQRVVHLLCRAALNVLCLW